MAETMFNILDFGAVGDEKTDCTNAINEALLEAGKVNGVVTVPPGKYLCGTIKMPEATSLIGYPSWCFRDDGGSILILNDENAKCCIDMTGAFGSTLKGLCVNGRHLGKFIHGVMIDKEKYDQGGKEDTPRIEDCRIGSFTGDGVHLNRIWCFSIRHCMLCFNGRHGLYINGWDGFILDNWMSGNQGAGMAGDTALASCTVTGNRVEWNVLAGFYIEHGNQLNITGNYFDRSGGPAFRMTAKNGNVSNNVTITGNVFYRSGKPRHKPFDSEYESSQVWLDYCMNLVMTGNSFLVGKDDGGKGNLSPQYGIVYGHLWSSIIKDNVLNNGALKQVLCDLGGHKENVIVKDNIGTPVGNADKYTWPKW